MEKLKKIGENQRMLNASVKSIQYLCRFLQAILTDWRIRRKLDWLAGNCAGFRKGLRFIDSLVGFIRMIGKKKIGVLELGNNFRLIFNVLDHCLFRNIFAKSEKTQKTLLLLRNWVWVMCVVINIVGGCYKTAILRQNLQQLRDQNAHKNLSKLKSKYNKLQLKDKFNIEETISNVFDLPLAIYSSNHSLLSREFSSLMGLLSAISLFPFLFSQIRLN